MPLDLPEIEDDYTKRYFLDYEGPAGKHTMLFRFDPSASDADCKGKITNVVNALKTQVHSTVLFNGLRYSAPATRVSFPTTWTTIVGTNTITPLPQNYPAFISLVGRDTQGRRARLMLLGVSGVPDADYRIQRQDHAQYATIIDTVRAATPTPLMSKGGFTVIWNDYINAGFHSYFQRKRRIVA